MADFNPSPRASKRRRTGTYATRRTTLTTLGLGQNKGPGGQDQVEDMSHVTSDELAPNERVQDTREFIMQDSATIVSGARETGSRRSSGRAKPLSGEAVKTTTDPAPKDPNKTTRKSRDNRGHAVEQDGQASKALEANNETSIEGSEEQSAVDSQSRSSGRARRAPRRFSLNASHKTSLPQSENSHLKSKQQPKVAPNEAVSTSNSPHPQGILTPSRHGRQKRTGPRKSVVFEADEKRIEEQLGFKDIDSSKKPKDKKKVTATSKSTLPPQSEPAEPEVASENDAREPLQPLMEETGDVADDMEIEAAVDVDEFLSQPPNSVFHAHEYMQSLAEDEHVAGIKSEILRRITDQTLSPISHLQTQYTTLHSLLTATITAGESNSLLLLGSRGSGKSLLISHCLADVTRLHGDDFHVVRLNGFFQTDDKLALREIWRQLGREMAVSEDETGEISSYADTMASLLSLLSHPEELEDPDAMMVDPPNPENREEGVNKTTKSIIFILDEFDLFTTHPRQTLLYNLFDIAQAKKAPIAVIGCSTRMDVVDCLEKRVKSRFSHRWLHIPGAKSLNAFEEAIKTILVMAVDGKEALGVAKGNLEWRQRWNNAIKNQLLPAPTTQALLKKTFHSSKSIPDVLAALYISIATISVPAPDAIEAARSEKEEDNTPAVVHMTSRSISTPSLLTLLPQLPTLHLSLLIAAARLETIHNFTAANFALVHTHYVELLTRSKLQNSSLSALTKGGALTGAGLRQWTKETARGAWEELAQWEVIVPVSGGGAGGLNDEGLGGDGIGTRMFRVDVTIDEIAWAVKGEMGRGGAGEVLAKWCREI